MLSPISNRLLLSFLPLLLLSPAALFGEDAGRDWPQFRGPDRDGQSPATDLRRDWTETAPQELWRVPLGEGYSGISVVGDRLFTLFSHEGKEYLGSFEAKSGKQLWRTELSPALETSMGNGPRSTPTIADGVAYVLGTDAFVSAVSTEDGSILWRVDLQQRFGSRLPQWGPSSSPLVDGDLVLVEAGGEEAGFAALNRKTGETLWTAFDQRMGYSSPILLPVGDEAHYVFAPSAARQLVGLSREGKVLWTHEWHGGTLVSPLPMGPGKFFISASNDVGGALIEVTEKDGEFSTREIWKNREMKNHFSNSVLSGGFLYGFDNGTFKCVSAETGERRWVKRGLGKGSLLVADGHLIVLSERGQLVLVEATPEEYREKGSLQVFSSKVWTGPSLAAGRLYLRDMNEMVCLDLAS